MFFLAMQSLRISSWLLSSWLLSNGLMSGWLMSSGLISGWLMSSGLMSGCPLSIGLFCPTRAVLTCQVRPASRWSTRKCRGCSRSLPAAAGRWRSTAAPAAGPWAAAPPWWWAAEVGTSTLETDRRDIRPTRSKVSSRASRFLLLIISGIHVVYGRPSGSVGNCTIYLTHWSSSQ